MDKEVVEGLFAAAALGVGDGHRFVTALTACQMFTQAAAGHFAAAKQASSF
jgi:hypothetical protein